MAAPRLTGRRHTPARPARCPPLPRAAAWAPAVAADTPFAAAASGEWDGMLVTYDAKGEAQELPPSVVPAAFREWEVSVRDWQTQCSTVVDGSGVLRYRLRRLVREESEKRGRAASPQRRRARPAHPLPSLQLPSVGCEADATAFVDAEVAGLGGAGDPPATADGSFVLAPPALAPGAAVEHCLATAPGRRVRLRIVVGGAGSRESPFFAARTELHRETFDSPFRGGETLAGCGGSVPQFAGAAALEGAALDGGGWVVADEKAWAATAAGLARAEPSPDPASGSDPGRLLLPDAWVAVRPGEGGRVTVEGGVAARAGERRVAAATFAPGGALEAVRLATETRPA